MKEWAIKHPILTFLLIDTLIAGISNVAVVCTVKGRLPQKDPVIEVKEPTEEE